MVSPLVVLSLCIHYNTHTRITLSDDTAPFSPQVNVPKQRKTFCPSCKCHSTFKVTQYKAGKASLHVQGKLAKKNVGWQVGDNLHPGKRRFDMKQRGYGGQTKPIFKKKAKTHQEDCPEDGVSQVQEEKTGAPEKV